MYTLPYNDFFFCNKISNYLYVEVQDTSFIKFQCFIYQHFMSYYKMSRRDVRQGSPVHKRPRTNKTHHLI